MKRKKVAIIGATGMLGSSIYQVFKDKYQLVLTYRDKKKFQALEKYYGKAGRSKTITHNFTDIFTDYLKGFPKNKLSPSLKEFIDEIGPIDTIINCAGVINKYASQNPSVTFFTNSALPHLLSSVYKEKLIHVTTDCVFDGIAGAPYDENSLHSATDLYGISKSLGEPSENSLVFRTSIIGREIANYSSLLEWFLQQKGKTVPGFTNHLWNGLTAKQFAIVCDQIINQRSRYPKTGIFHIFSTSLSKYEMLLSFKKKFKINIKIFPQKSFPIDRRLTSQYNLCSKLKIPTFNKMLNELN